MFDLFSHSQTSLDFPVSLTERYRPLTMSQFVGLSKPKAICAKLAARPFPSAWLFVGPSGTGKTTMAAALAVARKAYAFGPCR
jgi:replication-associated recombination protein RarA